MNQDPFGYTDPSPGLDLSGMRITTQRSRKIFLIGEEYGNMGLKELEIFCNSTEPAGVGGGGGGVLASK
jgi:hypothetical protein